MVCSVCHMRLRPGITTKDVSEKNVVIWGGLSYTERMTMRDDEAITERYAHGRKTAVAKDPDVWTNREQSLEPTPRGDRQPPHSREERVLAAATDVFLRYGFARTTMGDIAERAGISRPALYLVFPGKEEVFAAVIHRMADEQFARIRAALATLPTLREKLLFACETWGMHGFTLTTAHPDARDLFNLASIPVQQMYAAFQALIAELLVEPAGASSVRATPEELARVLIFAMRGFRETVADERDVRRLISLQVSLLLAALEDRN